MTNLMRDGTLTSVVQLTPNWYSFTASKVNDGDTVNYFANTNSQSATDNNGRGIAMTFNRSVALTSLVTYGYDYPGHQFSWVIQYYNGSSWVTVATLANSAAGQIYNFNADQAITSTQWRMYIANWVQLGDNYYIREVEAYELRASVNYLRNRGRDRLMLTSVSGV